MLSQRLITCARCLLLTACLRCRYMSDKASKPFAAPTGTQRLFDLVSPKPEAAANAAKGASKDAATQAKLRTAFYFALRDTLVADSIDGAVKIAYRPDGSVQHRVVTLAGELIDR